MPKILAIDLDGTLFYPKKRFRLIPKKNLEFIQKFIDNGGILIIVTGRNYFFAHRVYKKINRPFYLYGCNSSIFIKDNIIKEEIFFDNNELTKFLDRIEKRFEPTTYVIMSKTENCLLYAKRQKFRTLFGYPFYYLSEGVYRENYKISKRKFINELKNGKIYKVMVFPGVGKKATALSSIMSKYLNTNDPFCEISWSGSSLELTPKGVSKTRGINEFLEKNNFDKNDVYVVGDSGNDIVMFKEFYKHSFCMTHASSSVKKYAKHIIENVYELESYLFK